jgi:crossover junction endodeoxyribonuclease RusA
MPLGDGEIMLSVTFNPPDKRRRDLDGMFSNVKAGLDGIADAMCADDYRFAFTIRRAEPVKGGRVVVAIGAAE